MTISKRLVLRYQQLYENKFGKSISTKKAEQELFDLKELVRLINVEKKERHGRK